MSNNKICIPSRALTKEEETDVDNALKRSKKIKGRIPGFDKKSIKSIKIKDK